MSIVGSFKSCVKEKYLTAAGRASRYELNSFIFIYFLGPVCWSFFLHAIHERYPDWTELDTLTYNLIVLWCIFLFLPSVMVAMRRLHDLGWSRVVVFTFCIPIWQVILFFLLVFKKGEEGHNEYGDDPTEETD